MLIGIVVHSLTGNNLRVAEKIKEKLDLNGHSTFIERIRAVDENQNTAFDFELETVPDLGRYEGLVFVAPVRAFSLSPVMAEFLRRMPSLGDRKTAGCVGQFFPFSWMGGKQAIAKLKKLCSAKGLTLSASAIVNWTGGRTRRQIEALAERFAALFQ